MIKLLTKWPVLVGVSALLVAILYIPVLSNRILLWDDLSHLCNLATAEGFQKHLWYSMLHFIPMLQVTYASLTRFFALDQIPFVTSAWIAFFLAWFVYAFVRFARILGFSPVPILVGSLFFLLNPMLAEVVTWFCSSFYLVGLVLALESLVQFEMGLKTQATYRWVLAAFFAAIAPNFWTMGYIAGPYMVISVWFARHEIKSKTPIIAVLAVAFLTYPLLRLYAQTVAEHHYGLVPAMPWKVADLLVRVIPDSLLLGSFGFWGHPYARMRFPNQLYLLLFVCLSVLVWKLWQEKKNRKILAFAIASIVIGYAVPYCVRGNERDYLENRWFLRYNPTPLFGAALIVSLLFQTTAHVRKAVWVVAAYFFLKGAYSHQLHDHYLKAAFWNYGVGSLRPGQEAQLAFLDTLFQRARELGVRPKDLIARFFVPVNGLDYINAVQMYSGVPKAEERDLTPETVAELKKVFAAHDIGKHYQVVLPGDYIPLGEWQTKPQEVPSQPIPNAAAVVREARLDQQTPDGKLFTLFSLDNRISIPVPPEQSRISSLSIPLKMVNVNHYNVRVWFEFVNPEISPVGTTVVCTKSEECNFFLPADELPWFPKQPVKNIVLNPMVPGGNQFWVGIPKVAGPAAQVTSVGVKPGAS